MFAFKIAEILFSVSLICGALRDLVLFAQFKKREKKNHEVVLILVKLQASAYNFTKINTPPWFFFTFFKLYKWHQIAQRITFTNSFQNAVQNDLFIV